MVEKNVATGPKKTKFVTIIAISFMVISFLSILGYLHSVISSPDLIPDIRRQLEGSVINIVFVVLSIATFVLSISTFVACIGLLKRKNWARITFMTNLWVAILLNMILLFAVHKLYFFATQTTLSLGVSWLDNLLNVGVEILSAFLFVAYVATLIYAFISTVLFGWLIKKFSANNIKTEFGALPREVNHWSLS